MSDFIRISGFPPKHAEEAFSAGYYLEAVQTLHAWIECKLRELLLLQRTLLGAEFDAWPIAWDVSNEVLLTDASKVLLILGAISEAQYRDLTDFNSVRDNLLYRMFYDPHDESWPGVAKNHLLDTFQNALRLSNEIDGQSAEVNIQNRLQ